MFVDTDLLHSGANESHRAGGHAQEGAAALSRGPLASGMFGGFPAAEAFHESVTAAHGRHVKNLQAHQETLTGLGHKAHYAADEFTNMDDRNAADERAVRWTSDTSATHT
ncbi:DUF2563 family protein [Mycobacterium sp. 1081908.1]|uniref:DUF2563 family protein n=1 Tax=Mycobacterium sp. 1081908.1 TaxID=1834066 RepID=UPI0007FB891E|nr:DUF2563 family protein [Mycobacterium sp. 1081908.1]OBK50815.1 hypothetical protein A5655_24500 [Mycobacterium sp. 1081908.1]